MKWFSRSKISCVLLLFVAVLSAEAVLGQSAITSDTEVIITIAGQEQRYQPQPELGYVVKSQDNSDAVIGAYGDISLFADMQIKAVEGRDRRGIWIVESGQSAAQNKAIIETLGVQSQVQYVAPLFSCNGETEAIIPEIVVRVTSGTQSEEVREICRTLNLRIKRKMMFTEQEYLIDVSGTNTESVFDALIKLNQSEFIEWAAPNTAFQRKRSEAPVTENNSQGDIYLFNASQTSNTTGLMPNDEYFPMQWHLHNTGQFGGTPDADINAPEAWEITTGDPNIVVVVHDVGIELNHPDLVNNLVQGYDFYDDDDLPNPSGDAHGTECAGIIAAECNNDIGVVGVAYNCKVMPIRDGTGNSYITWAEEAEAVRWAAVNGADVLSNSWGINSPRAIFDSAIVDVTKAGGIGRDGRGCVVFASSGNDGILSLLYPAANPEVIAVGATDSNDERWSYSNYGPELDIVAPGGERWYYAPNGKAWPEEGNGIWTTDITGPPGTSSHAKSPFPDIQDYALFGGTSSSCPVAAGIAALILSVEPELTNEEVRHFLCRSARDLGDPGRDDYYGWGRVDARAALDMVLAKRCDLNNDWKVDELDLAILNAAIETNDPFTDIAPSTKRDGVVDEQDFDLMMYYWQTEIPELGLVAHWKLDEIEGDIAYDSAFDLDSIVLGNPTWQPTGGMIDGALELDSIDDYISTPFVLNPAEGKFSVFVWVKGGVPGQVILSQIGGKNWLLADPIEGYLITELKAHGRSGKPLQSQTNITNGNWHRIGLVWDGSLRTLYVDDVAVAEDTQDGLNGSESGLYIGCGKTMESGTFWSGLIDDVRIYNRAVHP